MTNDPLAVEHLSPLATLVDEVLAGVGYEVAPAIDAIDDAVPGYGGLFNPATISGTAIVSIGSIEQHGPHLPLNMDTLDGETLSFRIAQELGDALVAPAIRPGCSGHHMEFPGTITIPPETLMDTIRAYCRSLDEHGFDQIVLIPTHGGNFAPVKTVAPEIAREIDASVIPLADLDEHMQLLNEGLSEAGIKYNQDVIHAGAAETAVMLAIDADLVREAAIEQGHEGDISPGRLLSEGFKSITQNGVLGDPHKATTQAGDRIIEKVTNTYVEQIRTERQAT